MALEISLIGLKLLHYSLGVVESFDGEKEATVWRGMVSHHSFTDVIFEFDGFGKVHELQKVVVFDTDGEDAEGTRPSFVGY